MISTRKRKIMLKKLNDYFATYKKIPSEKEYATRKDAPYRSAMIVKYLGGWNKMIYYLGFYYPQWKVVAAPVVEAPKSALKKKEDAE